MKVIDWRITTDCNENCEYCFSEQRKYCITENVKMQITNAIISSNCHIVNITGGEPMLSPQCTINIFKQLNQKGKIIYLSTNGTNIVPYLTEITSYIHIIGLPLDGYDSYSNSLNGRLTTSYHNIINIIHLLKSYHPKLHIKIGTVITRKNYSFEILKNMANQLSYFSINNWRIYELIPENRGYSNRKFLELSTIQSTHLALWISELQKMYPSINIEFISRKDRNKAYFIILPNGEVMIPIESKGQVVEKHIGNVLHQSIYDIELEWKKWTNNTKTLSRPS